jgi:type IV secretion system protein VirB5
MWQIIALVSLTSFFFALGILVYAVNLPKTVPVVVTVAPDGQAAYFGRIDKSLYGKDAIPEIAKEYQIKRLLTLMHTWVIDPAAQKRYILETQSIVQGGAIAELDQFYRGNNPYEHLGERTKSVTLDPPLKQTDKTYVAYFTTTEKNQNGYEIQVTRWSSLVNLDYYEAIPENPLGVYITNFDIKRMEQ